MHYLDYLVASHHFGPPLGLASVCSAHPLVIEAALRHGLTQPQPVLIEATCNQVNQFGGYTGHTPADFACFVQQIAARLGFPGERLMLGGDHLGPLPWAGEPAQSAMQKAADLVHACVQAGFNKIHLDCSMPLGGERDLPLKVIAERTAILAEIAETTLREARNSYPEFRIPNSEFRIPNSEFRISNPDLRYVIGSEVPPAGGAKAGETHLAVTAPEAAAETLELTRRAFQGRGLDSAWERVRALVVQPGVEYGDETIHDYDPAAAAGLKRFIETVPGMVYEAHSTDYQTPVALRALVEDHFAILKVGPALTFALREAVFALAEMEETLGIESSSHIREALEEAMLANPVHWQKHYGGSPPRQKFARACSFSDRIRYYWNAPAAQSAFGRLMENLGQRSLPLTLLSQYMPRQYEKVRSGELKNHPRELLLARVADVLNIYATACQC